MDMDAYRAALERVPSVTLEEVERMAAALERNFRQAEHRAVLEGKLREFDIPEDRRGRLVVPPEFAARAGLKDGDEILGFTIVTSAPVPVRGSSPSGKTSAAAGMGGAPGLLAPTRRPPPFPARQRSPGTRAKARWKRLRRTRG